jgi:hypothetical protein
MNETYNIYAILMTQTNNNIILAEQQRKTYDKYITVLHEQKKCLENLITTSINNKKQVIANDNPSTSSVEDQLAILEQDSEDIWQRKEQARKHMIEQENQVLESQIEQTLKQETQVSKVSKVKEVKEVKEVSKVNEIKEIKEVKESPILNPLLRLTKNQRNILMKNMFKKAQISVTELYPDINDPQSRINEECNRLIENWVNEN